MFPSKLAIIGYGKIAQDQHIPAISASNAFTLSAVTSRHAKSVPGVERIFASEDDMYRQAPDIVCVSICSQPDQRYHSARRALLAGKHVMLEKPPAATLGEVRALRQLAHDKGLTLFATWHARQNPAVAEAASRLKGEQICGVKITWKEDVRRWHPGQTWVWTAGGFGVFDPGINALSIATALLPMPIFVQSAKLSVPSNRQQPIAADLVLGSEPPIEGLTATFDWRQTGAQTWDIEVRTRRGQTIIVSEGGAKLSVDGELVQTRPSQEYGDLYARFADLLAKGGSDLDLRPFELVADAFLCGERLTVEAFEDA